MAPVILRTYVHCHRCAAMMHKAIKNYLGVEEVWVSVDTGLVVVAGTSLNASLFKWRIESKTKRHVAIVSDGGAEEPPPPGYPYPYPYYGGMVPPATYAKPPPPPPPPPPAYPYGAAAFGWVPATAPPQHLLQYVPVELLHACQQYMPNEAPLWFNDENPHGSCSIL